MKKYLILLLFILPIGLWAQDSGDEVGRRVLSLGRSWNYKRKTADGTTETVSLTLVRDTTIAGHQAFIASYKTPEGYKECFALQEEETGEVFSYDISHEMEKNGLIPMARLSMGISEFSWYDSNGLIRTETLPGTLQVQDEVVANGITRQRWQFFSDNTSSPSDIWVSGIGSQTYGILLPSRQADFVGEDKLQFVACTDADGQVLLTAGDFSCPRPDKYVYKPLLQDGKIWYCASFRTGTNEQGAEAVGWYYQYYTAGDTIVGGMPCLKVYGYNHYMSGKTEYLGAMHEKSGKVWFFASGTEMGEMLYDFTSVAGDSYGITFRGQHYTTTKLGDCYAKRNGVAWHTHVFNNMDLTEGLGPEQGLLMPMMARRTGAYFQLLLCTEDDQVIYDSGDIDRAVVMSMDMPEVSRPIAAVYDLQGREIKNAKVKMKNGGNLPKGVYIVNGRKVIVK